MNNHQKLDTDNHVALQVYLSDLKTIVDMLDEDNIRTFDVLLKFVMPGEKSRLDQYDVDSLFVGKHKDLMTEFVSASLEYWMAIQDYRARETDYSGEKAYFYSKYNEVLKVTETRL